MTEIKGWHVFSGFAFAFGIIIAVNLTLAFNAVRTFPGLEVKNSYVASQSFDADRAAQMALNWQVSADLAGGELRLEILQDGKPIAPEIESATFGRATSVAQDQTPDFVFDGNLLRAPVVANGGNWNLRLKARAEDGTLFQQRIIVRVAR
ncbi:FixH family protein [Yoonia sediminilitoris]|uniref:Nitrogen fixation protein FixH n=1 Tax=Yoonia sediminilitoris TaxID=1286148 RepID=A0A2T6KI59_9RHOB|nr:FixH family protein [Yoonia sediminilitoris]PUB15403.1 nitrogen fixation protein FixH [Yoonia sediminilitoris]RCW96013.1 nitrogen fixation protein FixH [Yoonia sediminilitoris]